MTPTASGIYPRRAKAGLAIILFMAVLALGTIAGYHSVLQRNPVNADGITISEQRLEALRGLLPKRGIVGYLSDTGAAMENARSYYLTAYALAPVVVAADANREWVVANFASPSAISKIAAANGLTVARDFGNGIALLRRKGR